MRVNAGGDAGIARGPSRAETATVDIEKRVKPIPKTPAPARSRRAEGAGPAVRVHGRLRPAVFMCVRDGEGITPDTPRKYRIVFQNNWCR